MSVPGCPRCTTPVARDGAGVWSCPEHGPVAPLWRAPEASYDAFAEHLVRAGEFPTYLPWPLSPGWSVTDVAAAGEEGAVRATMTGCSGTSDADGPVDVLVVTEEAGVGLGARVAGTRHADPGPGLGDGPPLATVRVEGQGVRLWTVSTSTEPGEWDRSVLAGEAGGRWLWVVLRPASAILLLRGEWILRDVSGLGAPLVDLPYGGPHPLW
ncbi:DUF6758 family protein [Nocardioides sp. zg-DK7169]|uniref:DUF6758 family protein n=1 Tax=Nocardioides sp. zg-DK7169 TaxID=2736600 RepID=UPI001557F382|nr:DUF6758 family protein [Nocardioides sp. zg-DK7169]NPC95958.1 hypothetical protein [Nocardioides sp. zg-DK7169]